MFSSLIVGRLPAVLRLNRDINCSIPAVAAETRALFLQKEGRLFRVQRERACGLGFFLHGQSMLQGVMMVAGWDGFDSEAIGKRGVNVQPLKRRKGT